MFALSGLNPRNGSGRLHQVLLATEYYRGSSPRLDEKLDEFSDEYEKLVRKMKRGHTAQAEWATIATIGCTISVLIPTARSVQK